MGMGDRMRYTIRDIRYQCPVCNKMVERLESSNQRYSPPVCDCAGKPIMVLNPRDYAKADWFGPLGKPPKAWVEEAHEGCELENQLGR